MRIVAAAVFIVSVLCIIPLGTVAYASLQSGPKYDCDDATLWAVTWLERLHIPYAIMWGEAFGDHPPHVWAEAKLPFGKRITVDWGIRLRPIVNYPERREITKDKLLGHVAYDLTPN